MVKYTCPCTKVARRSRQTRDKASQQFFSLGLFIWNYVFFSLFLVCTMENGGRMKEVDGMGVV